MTPLKILLVEDIIVTAMDLRQTLEKANHTISGIARTLQAARKSVIANPPDLAIVDILLEKDSVGDGIDTVKELLIFHQMPIIYLTGNSEPDLFRSAKETQPAAYLIKPFNSTELLFNVELAYHYFQERIMVPPNAPLPNYILLPVGKGLERIDFNDVMYLEADGSYAKVFMINKTVYTVSTNLGQLEQYFQASNFFRVSRSYVANLDYTKRIKDNELLLDNGRITLPISPEKRQGLLKRMMIVRTKKIPH